MREAGEWLEEAENELKQEVGRTSLLSTSFFSGAGRKRTSRRESERGLMKYRSEMVSPLRQGSLQANGCEGEQGERSNGTEKDNAREGEHKSRGSV